MDSNNKIQEYCFIKNSSSINNKISVIINNTSLKFNSQDIKKDLTLPEVKNSILNTSHYPEFLYAIEAGCEKLGIEALYFDFPKQEFGSDFYNPKIYGFLQTIYHLHKEFSHIIFNQDPKLRDTNRTDIFLQSQIISLITKKNHFESLTRLLEIHHSNDIIQIENNIIKNMDNSYTYIEKSAIGVLTTQIKKSTILSNENINEFFKVILSKLEILGNSEYQKVTKNHDTLTGLFNQHYLDEQINFYEKNNIPLTFLKIDIGINNKYGQDVNDVFIKEIASYLNTLIKNHNHQYVINSSPALISRIGGSLFQVIIPYGKERTINELSKKIEDYLQINPIKYGNDLFILQAGIEVNINKHKLFL